LLLRTAEGEATVFDVAGKAGGFASVRDWPEQMATLPIYRVVPLKDGGFAGLPEAGNIVLLWRESQSLVVRALPPGFRACALDQDEHGRLYVAGSNITARLRSTKRRHASAVSPDLGLSWDGVTTRKCQNCPVHEATAIFARSAIRGGTRFFNVPRRRRR